MKRHLNTLFVTSQGAYLSKDHEAVKVQVDGQPDLRIPIHNLESILCFGRVSCSPFLLGHCGRRGVHLSFLTARGRFLARVHGPVAGNVLLRREQYRRADRIDASAKIAHCIVLAKLNNSRTLLMRALRDHPAASGRESLEKCIKKLACQIREARHSESLDRLRGLEGLAARHYFGVFDHLIVRRKQEFSFRRRSRRPPMDRVNSLLSFVYTLLLNDVSSALEGAGLDPAVGFLHQDRPGRPGLALDLMEELRSYLGDRLAISMINRGRLSRKHFEHRETGGVFLNEIGRKRVLKDYQRRKDDTLIHPFLREKTFVGMIPHLQALLLARHLRGDLDGYPPFLTRG